MQLSIDKNVWKKFIKMTKTPFFNKGLGRFIVTITKPDGSGSSKLINNQELQDIDFVEKSEIDLPLIIIPSIVFRDAVKKNMFEHASISKRCRFIASNEKDMKRLLKIVNHIEKKERLPLEITLRQLSRFAVAYIRRWRELFVYSQAVYYKYYKKLPLYLVEEKILKKT
jgi:hypothetical protein